MSTSKYSFENDYSELVHPTVLNALSAFGTKQFKGYGLDAYSARAIELIREKIQAPKASVHFVGGGTQANLITVSYLLRPFEAAIAPESGHISLHEAGAIEATGHKVCTVPDHQGKLSPKDIEAILATHRDEHKVKPGLVYISQSTEYGTVYTKAELAAISACCRENGLFLFIDGIRLGAALCNPGCDMGFGDIANYADAFTLGGTKNGALYGEAIVICSDRIDIQGFRYYLKQRGALFAKTAAIGAQFEALLQDGLYEELAGHANKAAMKLAEGIKGLGYSFLYPPETNQIFPIFPVDTVKKLRCSYDFHDWEQMGDRTAVRLITSWATPLETVDQFIADLREA